MRIHEQAEAVREAWCDGRERHFGGFWTDGVAVAIRNRVTLIRDLDPDYVLLHLPSEVTPAFTNRIREFLNVPGQVKYGYGVRVRWSDADIKAAGADYLVGGEFRLISHSRVYRMPVCLLAEKARALNPYTRKYLWSGLAVEKHLRGWARTGFDTPIESVPFSDLPLADRPSALSSFAIHPKNRKNGRWIHPVVSTYNAAVGVFATTTMKKMRARRGFVAWCESRGLFASDLVSLSPSEENLFARAIEYPARNNNPVAYAWWKNAPLWYTRWILNARKWREELDR